MTDRTTRHVLAAGDFVLLLQACSEIELIRRRLVRHVEDLISRAQVLLWRPMAVKAPLHLKRLGLVHQRHLVDRAVAGRTADALTYMDLMIEVNEIGEVVYPNP